MKSTANSAASAQAAAVPTASTVLTVSKAEESKPKTETATQTTLLLPAEKTPPTGTKEISTSSILEKAEKLHLLKNKYEELNNKRKSLDLFELSHDKDNAQMQLADANGLSFESSNPRCIKKVIEIWKEEYSTAIEETEKQMRLLIGA